MFPQLRRQVESYLVEHDRRPLESFKFVGWDDSKGPIAGCFLLVFHESTEHPVLIAKGAPTETTRRRDGKIIYRIEFDNLTELQRNGMNRERRTTPEPLALLEDGEMIVTLQSGLPGRIMKNVSGRELFSEQALPATLDALLSWWDRFQQRSGVTRKRLTEEVYRDRILRPVELYRRRFVVDEEQRRFLDRRFREEKRLLGSEIPLMVRHGDFCTANVMDQSGNVAVFDWEFPLEHQLPLFDLFHFFSSTRYPFTGLRGESSHYESFKAVYWGDTYFADAVRRSIRRLCEQYAIADGLVEDLFLLSLIEIANLKYMGLVEVHGIDEEPPASRSDAEIRAQWEAVGGADKDVPFARIRDGVFENVGYIARSGFPEFQR